MINLQRILGLTGVIFLYTLAMLAPLLATHSPSEIELVESPQAPNPEHLFGTDQLGRDLFSRSLYGLRYSIIVATFATILTLAIGVFAGVLSGYFGGIIDWVLVSIIDCMLAFPSLLLTLAICATLGPGEKTLLLSLIFSGWASSARVIRSTVQSIRSKDFVTASRLLGANHFHILIRHIFPHCKGILSILLMLSLGTMILAESSLSFLGFGPPPPYPTLGKLVYDGARYFRAAPWWSFFPGLFIAMGIISFNLLGDSLQKRESPSC
ncbi:MAG: ABC transporter permease [Chlamydiae bacterium]|nr:ABC transporter permease [Chlamydiota bacterium]MBI3278198.1 ABC transporter permease [Chlamydiota bacterium]